MELKLATLIFAISLLSSEIKAQCKLDKQKDDYSNKTIISTKDVRIGGVGTKFGSSKYPWDIDLSFRLEDSTIFLILTHSYQNYQASKINQFFLKLDNELVIKSDSSSGARHYNGGRYQYAFTFFILTKEELAALSKNKIIKYKIFFRHFPDYPVYDTELKDKKSIEVKEIADCLLKELK